MIDRPVSTDVDIPASETATNDAQPCGWCDYDLRGLVASGRCPECGFEHGNEEKIDQEAALIFNNMFTRPMRLWVDARPSGARLKCSVRVMLMSFVAASAFVALNVGGTWIGARLSGPVYPQRGNIFGEYGTYGMYGFLIRFQWDHLFNVMLWHGAMICLLSLLVGLWFRRRLSSLSLGPYRRRLRFLMYHAASTVTPACAPTLFLTAAWQILDVATRLAPQKALPNAVQELLRALRFSPSTTNLAAVVVILINIISLCRFLLRHVQLTRQLTVLAHRAAPPPD